MRLRRVDNLDAGARLCGLLDILWRWCRGRCGWWCGFSLPWGWCLPCREVRQCPAWAARQTVWAESHLGRQAALLFLSVETAARVLAPAVLVRARGWRRWCGFRRRGRWWWWCLLFGGRRGRWRGCGCGCGGFLATGAAPNVRGTRAVSRLVLDRALLGVCVPTLPPNKEDRALRSCVLPARAALRVGRARAQSCGKRHRARLLPAVPALALRVFCLASGGGGWRWGGRRYECIGCRCDCMGVDRVGVVTHGCSK